MGATTLTEEVVPSRLPAKKSMSKKPPQNKQISMGTAALPEKVSPSRLHAKKSISKKPSRKKWFSQGKKRKIAKGLRQQSVRLPPAPSKADGLPPWIVDDQVASEIQRTTDMQKALHLEMLQLQRFVAPTLPECQRRDKVVRVISQLAQGLWPKCRVELIGSTCTGLCLPMSDVDVVVLGELNATRSAMDKLAGALKAQRGFARKIVVIKTSKVPIIKFVACDGNIACDISFGIENGLQTIKTVDSVLGLHPILKPLFLTLKYFMRQYNLNDASVGGLGSYTLFNMALSHLQMYYYNFGNASDSFKGGGNDKDEDGGVKQKKRESTNLGYLLERFFRLYGEIFDVANVGIQTRKGGCYFNQLDRYPKHQRGKGLRFCVEDLNDCNNVMGGNCTQTKRIRAAFAAASAALRAWNPNQVSCSMTPLGMILYLMPDFKERRKLVVAELALKQKSTTVVRDAVAAAPLTVRNSAETVLSAMVEQKTIHGCDIPTQVPQMRLSSSSKSTKKAIGRGLSESEKKVNNAIFFEDREGKCQEICCMTRVSQQVETNTSVATECKIFVRCSTVSVEPSTPIGRLLRDEICQNVRANKRKSSRCA